MDNVPVRPRIVCPRESPGASRLPSDYNGRQPEVSFWRMAGLRQPVPCSCLQQPRSPLGRGGPNLVAAHDHRHQTLVVLQLPPPSPSRRALPLSPRFPTIVGIRSTVNRQPGDLPQLQFSHLFRPSMPPCPHLPVLRRKAPTIQVLPWPAAIGHTSAVLRRSAPCRPLPRRHPLNHQPRLTHGACKLSCVTTPTQPSLTMLSMACHMVLTLVIEGHDGVLRPPTSPLLFLIPTSFLLISRRPVSGRKQQAHIPPLPSRIFIAQVSVRSPRRMESYAQSITCRPPWVRASMTASPVRNSSLHYVTVDNAISLITQHGPGAYLAKVDVKSAFRTCPVRREDWSLLGIEWDGKYYFERVLPFGLRSSPFIFNTVADALGMDSPKQVLSSGHPALLGRLSECVRGLALPGNATVGYHPVSLSLPRHPSCRGKNRGPIPSAGLSGHPPGHYPLRGEATPRQARWPPGHSSAVQLTEFYHEERTRFSLGQALVRSTSYRTRPHLYASSVGPEGQVRPSKDQATLSGSSRRCMPSRYQVVECLPRRLERQVFLPPQHVDAGHRARFVHWRQWRLGIRRLLRCGATMDTGSMVGRRQGEVHRVQGALRNRRGMCNRGGTIGHRGASSSTVTTKRSSPASGLGQAEHRI